MCVCACMLVCVCVCVCVCACMHAYKYYFLHSNTFFFVAEMYSFPELRSRLRFDFCHLSTLLFRFLVGVEPVLGPHSQPSGSTVDEEPVEDLVPGLSLSVDLDALGPALDGPGLMPVAIF